MKDYKKILEGVVDIISTTEKSDIGFANICAYIGENCPELKESEDERIRKEIIKYFKKYQALSLGDYNIQDILDWLEKQGEQKSLDEITKEVTKDKDAAVSFFKSAGIINENGELADEYKIEQGEQNYQEKVVDNLHNYLYGEQKPAVWTAEDEEELKIALNTLEKAGQYSSAKWLKNVCLVPQPKQEWSEEDESLRRRCIGAIDMANLSDYTKDSLLNWLKSLRPQNNATDEELAQARKDAYNDALDKIEYHSGEPTFDDGWSAAIWYLKKRNAQP